MSRGRLTMCSSCKICNSYATFITRMSTLLCRHGVHNTHLVSSHPTSSIPISVDDLLWQFSRINSHLFFFFFYFKNNPSWNTFHIKRKKRKQFMQKEKGGRVTVVWWHKIPNIYIFLESRKYFVESIKYYIMI